CAIVRACSALLAFWLVIDDICSRDADVSSRDAACSLLPSANSWLAWATCWEALERCSLPTLNPSATPFSPAVTLLRTQTATAKARPIPATDAITQVHQAAAYVCSAVRSASTI